MRATSGVAIVVAILLPVSVAAQPLREPVVGPMLVCFKYSSFRLAAGEQITDFGGSPEALLITIEGRGGAYQIGESEIFAKPIQKRLISDRDGTRVYRVGPAGYEIAGKTSYSDGGDEFILSLDGEALAGTVRDARIYRRLTVGDPARLSCKMTFTYHW
jgi:hypothetical protein